MRAISQHHLLGEILLQENLITEDELKRSLNKHKRTKVPLGQILLREELVTEEQLLRALARQMGFSYIDLRRIEINEKAVEYVDEKIAERYGILPVNVDQDSLTIAVSDPLNMSVVDDLFLLTGLRIKVVVAPQKDIEWGINRYYLPREHQQQQDHIQPADSKPEAGSPILTSEEAITTSEPVLSFVHSMISKAIARRASDIHIEQHETETVVRYRIDGVLHDMMTIPDDLTAGVISRLKIMSGMQITEKRRPQDGGFHLNVEQKDIDVRISTMPTIFGEKMVLRLLFKEHIFRLDELGFSPDNLKKIRESIRYQSGIVLLTGPTGSGKTTTLYAILNELNNQEKNIITLEDPVEYVLPRINQIQVNTKAGLTFASGLRTILRQDPDIIMVGEIRDEETARIAVQASLTGHLVLSTLHTSRAIGSYTRLLNMGLEPYLLASSLTGMVAQRLVRRICPECKTRVKLDDHILQNLRFVGRDRLPQTAYRGEGCFACQNTGYLGRIAVQEVIPVEDELRELMSQGATESELNRFIDTQSYATLIDDGLEKVRQGLTTFDEFLRVIHY
ncbi:MAG: Flp pilus assembly complex ATPase component TadA [Bacillaceae bacterium]|nr:Flp pilus assembly complex ATPase component TadA [Bacillaceae bacterium]